MFHTSFPIMQCSNPVFILIGGLGVGRAEKNVGVFWGVKTCWGHETGNKQFLCPINMISHVKLSVIKGLHICRSDMCLVKHH